MDAIVARLDASEAKIASLEKELASARAKQQAATQPTEKIKHLHPLIRSTFFLGGTVSFLFSLAGLIADDERFVWSGQNFLVFSMICLMIVVFSNPSAIDTPGERAISISVGIFGGLPLVLVGIALQRVDHTVTYQSGVLNTVLGIIWSSLAPFVVLRMNTLYSQKTDLEQHSLVVSLLRVSPQILGSVLYVSAEATRCLLRIESPAADPTPVMDQCGNPLVPTFYLNGILVTSWVVSILILPLATEQTKRISWSDLAGLNLPMQALFEGIILSSLGALGVLLFASLNEEGEAYGGYVKQVCLLFIIVWIFFMFYEVYDKLIKPAIGELCGDVVGDVSGDAADSRRGSDADIDTFTVVNPVKNASIENAATLEVTESEANTSTRDFRAQSTVFSGLYK
jgi:hypothetical protein